MIPRLGFGGGNGTLNDGVSGLSMPLGIPEQIDDNLSPSARLLRLLKSTNCTQRWVAGKELSQLSLLHEIGWTGVTTLILPSVSHALKEDREIVSKAAILGALGNLGAYLMQCDSVQGAVLLREILLEEVRLVLTCAESPAEIRNAAAHALILLTHHVPVAERRDTILPLPLSMAHDPDSAKNRALALQLLAVLAELLGGEVCLQFCVPQVGCLSEDAEPEVRQAAVCAIGALCRVIPGDVAQTRLLAPFLRCCDDSDAFMRRAAAENFICMAEALSPTAVAEFLLPKLRALLSDTSQAVQEGAQAALGPLLVYLVQANRLPRDLLWRFLHLVDCEECNGSTGAGTNVVSLTGPPNFNRSWLHGVFRQRSTLANRNNVRSSIWSSFTDSLTPPDWRRGSLTLETLYGNLPRASSVFCAFSIAAVLTTACGNAPRLFQRVQRSRRLNGDCGECYPRWQQSNADGEDTDNIVETASLYDGVYMKRHFVNSSDEDEEPAISTAEKQPCSYSQTDSHHASYRKAIFDTPSSLSSSSSSVSSSPSLSPSPSASPVDSPQSIRSAPQEFVTCIESLNDELPHTPYEWWWRCFRRPLFLLLRPHGSCVVSTACRKILASSVGLLAETLLKSERKCPGCATRRQSCFFNERRREELNCVISPRWGSERGGVDPRDNEPKRTFSCRLAPSSRTQHGLAMRRTNRTSRLRWSQLVEDVTDVVLDLLGDSNAEVQVAMASQIPAVLPLVSSTARVTILNALRATVVSNIKETVSSHAVTVCHTHFGMHGDGETSSPNDVFEIQDLQQFLGERRAPVTGPLTLINRLRNLPFLLHSRNTSNTLISGSTGVLCDTAQQLPERDPQRMPSWRVRLQIVLHFDKVLLLAAQSPGAKEVVQGIFSVLLADPTAEVRGAAARHTFLAIQVYCPTLAFLSEAAGENGSTLQSSKEMWIEAKRITQLPGVVATRLKLLQTHQQVPPTVSTSASQNSRQKEEDDQPSSEPQLTNDRRSDKGTDDKDLVHLCFNRLVELSDELGFLCLFQSLAVSQDHHLRIVFLRCCLALYKATQEYTWVATLFTSFVFSDFLKLSKDPAIVVQTCWARCTEQLLNCRWCSLWRSQALRVAAKELRQRALRQCGARQLFGGVTAQEEIIKALSAVEGLTESVIESLDDGQSCADLMKDRPYLLAGHASMQEAQQVLPSLKASDLFMIAAPQRQQPAVFPTKGSQDQELNTRHFDLKEKNGEIV